MTNSFCSGIIGTSPAGLLKRPSYHVMKLYADHALPIPLTVGQARAAWTWWLCRTRIARKRFASSPSISNRSRSSCRSTSPNFGTRSSLRSGGETVCDTLDMRQPDVMNHWIAASRVRTVNLRTKGNRVTLPALSVSAVECGQRVKSSRE